MKNKMTIWFRQKIESICSKLEKSILSDKSLKCKAVFGPVHSRRLGSVLGISNVKPNVCSYNCIYCPSGKTTCCSVCSNYCLSPYELHLSVRIKLEELKKNGKTIDYIVFTGCGEPTLDSSLSNEIVLLREFGYKIAVFTNASLLTNDIIFNNLHFADYVSVKIDTVNEETWLKMNRPHRRLEYGSILDSIKRFSIKFQGSLTTETTFIKDINDNPEEIEQLSQYLSMLNCKASFFTSPMYPSAESFAISPDEAVLNNLSGLIKEKVKNPVLLCCPDTEDFFATDDFENELMGLLALHPVRVDAVMRFINGNGQSKTLRELINSRIIKEIDYNGSSYFAENIDEALSPAS
jgi:wyosine [tRNA(Phe)-imidazoG37] synthetase (radical SAM superfamily)